MNIGEVKRHSFANLKVIVAKEPKEYSGWLVLPCLLELPQQVFAIDVDIVQGTLGLQSHGHESIRLDVID